MDIITNLLLHVRNREATQLLSEGAGIEVWCWQVNDTDSKTEEDTIFLQDEEDHMG